MKTVFITSFFGLSARNILSTNILDLLSADPETRVIVLAPKTKEVEYRNYFFGNKKNVVVEGVSMNNPAMKTFEWASASRSLLDRSLFSIFLNSSDTATRRVYRIAERHKRGPVPAGFYWLLAKAGNWNLFRTLLRYLDYAILSKSYYDEYFEKYRPSLVFATDIFNEHDVNIMRE